TFRLALTGGYRVHRPADGTPAAGYSEFRRVLFRSKANSDRWDDDYTPRRRLASNAGNSTPTQTSSIRTRLGGLRSQMWFIPNSSGELGNGQSWNDPQALARPVTDGVQNSPKGTAVTTVPYNPRYNLLPAAHTSTDINDTACGNGEFGCETTTVQVCPAGDPNTHQGR